MQQEPQTYEEAKTIGYVKRQKYSLETAVDLMKMDSKSLEYLGKDLQTKIERTNAYELNIDDELDELQGLVRALEGLQQKLNKAVANLTEE